MRRRMDRRKDKAELRGRMKVIRYKDEILGADGQPIIIFDPDVLLQKRLRDEAFAAGKEGYNRPTITATFAQLMVEFVNNIPHDQGEDGKNPRTVKPEDLGNAYAVIKAFQGHKNGSVTIEDAVYEWLVELNKLDGPTFFKVTQAVIKERLADIIPEKE